MTTIWHNLRIFYFQYENLCLLERSSCVSRRMIKVLPLAVCGRNPCQYVLCGQGQKCEMDQDGVADCVCGTECQEKQEETILICPVLQDSGDLGTLSASLASVQ